MNGVSGRDYQSASVHDLESRVQKLEASLASVLNTIKWECEAPECRAANETPALLWKQLRFQLLCRKCSRMQNYQEHIIWLDPEPDDYNRERLARKRAALQTDRVHFSK